MNFFYRQRKSTQEAKSALREETVSQQEAIDHALDDHIKKSEQLQTQLNNLFLVNELSQRITSSLSIAESFNHLYNTINSMMNASVVELVVYEETGSQLFFTNKKYPVHLQPSSSYNHMSEWCFKNNKEVFLEDAENDYGRYVFKPLTLPDGNIARSIMVFPVQHLEKITGTLCIIGFTKNAFELFHKEMIRLLLPFVGVAINNAFTHQQIIELQQRAERSEHFMQVFLANMSHEIRTPMNAVMGMTNLLLQKNPLQEQLKYLDAIQKSSENLLVILNDILDLSKIEAGKIELEQIDFSVQEVVANVKSIMIHKAEGKGLSLITSIDKNISDVLIGDPTRLTQILINLVGNGIKFTEEGTVSIAVLLSANSNVDTQKHQQIVFHISDTGIGMSEEQQQKLFSKFSQASSETTRKYGGTGLGLNISKQLVQLQGGTIEVQSEPGKGSVFSLTLSFPVSERKEVLTKKQMASPDMLEQLNGIRILLADDNEYNRITVIETLQLKLRNIIIDEVQDGEQAINMLGRNDYDIVLMDLIMPKLDGLETTHIIRKKFPAPKNQIPVLALTASVIKSELDKCYDAGMNGFIPKPFQEYELYSSIYKALNKKEISSDVIAVQNSNSKHEKKIIDLKYLEEFTEGDAVRMQRHLHQFLSKIPLYLATLKEALAVSDHDSIRITAHSIRPLLKMIGNTRGAELTEYVEQCCVTKSDVDQLPSLITEIDNICYKVIDELKSHAENARKFLT